jgi:hypothetical protein
MIRTSSPSNGHPRAEARQQSETTEAVGPSLGPEDSVLPLLGDLIALECLAATLGTTAAADAAFLPAGSPQLVAYTIS